MIVTGRGTAESFPDPGGKGGWKMKRRHGWIRIILGTLLAASIPEGIVEGEYVEESWDDPGSMNHNWSYYDTDAPAPHDVAMNWEAAGGVGGGGYVWTSLNLLDTAHDLQVYWPAYLYRTIADDQEIDLTVPDAAVKVYARDVGTGAQLDLKGGQLVFFIGQYVVNNPDDPNDDQQSFFYNLTPLTIGVGDWGVENTIPVGDDSNWGVIVNDDPSVSPSDLFYHPEQFGFAIYPAASTPTGSLGIDSFRIVPEPGSAALILFGALMLGLRRRSRGDGC